MKALIYSAISGTLLAVPCHGILLFEETFEYPEGSLAGNTNPSAGVQWANITGEAGNSTVSGSDLINLNPESTGVVNSGGSLLQTASGRVAINLSAISEIDAPADGSTLYISFLQRFGDDSPGNSKICEFWNESTAPASTIFSYGKDTLSGTPELGLTLRKLQANMIPVSAPLEALDTETNLVVIRVDYGTGTDPDAIRFYLNPGSSEPATASAEADNSTANFNLTFDRIGLGSFQGGTMALDAIRIATTYEEAVESSADTDADGLPDSYEILNGLDINTNDADLDNDSDGGPDGLSNLEEFMNQTDPQDSDSDDDGINDGDEVSGALNPYESVDSRTVATTTPGLPTDPNQEDSDGDGLSDMEEIFAGTDTYVTNPNQSDTDGDTLPDIFESMNGIDPTDGTGENGIDGDPDEDGLFNDQEFEIGTNPKNPDTDEDGYSDSAESNSGFFSSSVVTGTDPLEADSDGDGLLDGMENPDEGNLNGPIHLSDPNLADTDLDGVDDFREVEDGTDPTDASSVVIPDIDLLSIIPFENSDFESPDITNESPEFPGWTSEFTRTIETSQYLSGRFSAAAGEASQVGNAFFRNRNPRAFLAQDIKGTTNLNTEVHSLSGIDLIGETLTVRLRIGIEAFVDGGFANGHGIVEIGLRNKLVGSEQPSWRESETFYTGSEEEATAAGIGRQIDRYLDLDENNVSGDATDYVKSYVIQDIPADRGRMVEFVITVDQAQAGDSGRALFDDIDIVLGTTFPSNSTPPTLSNISFDGRAFSVMANNLDPVVTYEFRRTTDLNAGFDEIIGAPFTPTDGTMLLTDPSPPVGSRAFYRVEEVSRP